ncbi:hypothetical protein AB0P12_14795 [Streptomyces subrutilus]|uniref:hypothetical protein n=1 Tax=Streptomyces subrutilus TaxID=36818 RepID=UPI0034346CD9
MNASADYEFDMWTASTRRFQQVLSTDTGAIWLDTDSTYGSGIPSLAREPVTEEMVRRMESEIRDLFQQEAQALTLHSTSVTLLREPGQADLLQLQIVGAADGGTAQFALTCPLPAPPPEPVIPPVELALTATYSRLSKKNIEIQVTNTSDQPVTAPFMAVTFTTPRRQGLYLYTEERRSRLEKFMDGCYALPETVFAPGTYVQPVPPYAGPDDEDACAVATVRLEYHDENDQVMAPGGVRRFAFGGFGDRLEEPLWEISVSTDRNFLYPS